MAWVRVAKVNLDVTALARKASATNARESADVIHACATIDTRRRLALVVLVLTVLAAEPWLAKAAVTVLLAHTYSVEAWRRDTLVEIALTQGSAEPGTTVTAELCSVACAYSPILTWRRGAWVCFFLARLARVTIWTETLESTAFVALRYVDTDAGVATRAGVATVTLLTVGTHVARATLALVPIHGDVGEADPLAGTVLSLAAIVRLDHNSQAHTLGPPPG
jgi:hypothetical protein